MLAARTIGRFSGSGARPGRFPRSDRLRRFTAASKRRQRRRSRGRLGRI